MDPDRDIIHKSSHLRSHNFSRDEILSNASTHLGTQKPQSPQVLRSIAFKLEDQERVT